MIWIYKELFNSIFISILNTEKIKTWTVKMLIKNKNNTNVNWKLWVLYTLKQIFHSNGSQASIFTVLSITRRNKNKMTNSPEGAEVGGAV